jgi:hypothetical protein
VKILAKVPQKENAATILGARMEVNEKDPSY